MRVLDQVEFLAPDTAFQEAREQFRAILERHKVSVAPAMVTFDLVTELVRVIEAETYAGFEGLARQRIDRRDEDDWPILVSALSLGCPVWTEDTARCGRHCSQRRPRSHMSNPMPVEYAIAM